ncbi:MAG: calcium-binding protein [Actinomycetota bacterium]
MSLFRRRPADSLENDLRRHRPEPREDFVRSLEARIAADRRPSPRSTGLRSRVALAGGLTALLLVVAAAFGGYGYASSALVHSGRVINDAVHLNFSPHTVGSVSAAADQYSKVTLCHQGHEISVAQAAVPAHLAQGDTIGSCPVFAPPVQGSSGDDTLNLSKSRVNAVVIDLKGDNTIVTNNKDNKVTTGTGNDTITTGKGSNLVKSGAGDDKIVSKGKDTIFSGTGDDTIDVRNGKPNYVNCGPGDDTVIADGASLDFVADNCEHVKRGKFKG